MPQQGKQFPPSEYSQRQEIASPRQAARNDIYPLRVFLPHAMIFRHNDSFQSGKYV
jgi:hypothetical protein